MKTLKEALADWTDWDVALYEMGACQGLWSSWPKDQVWPKSVKYVMWSSHPVGGMLSLQLDLLVKQGILEARKEPCQQYRWNQAFRGGWE